MASVRKIYYDRIQGDFIGAAIAHVIKTRRQIGIEDAKVGQPEVTFIEVYTTEEGKTAVNQNAAFPEHVLPQYRMLYFVQLNTADFDEPGIHHIFGWVFLSYGDNPLRKLKIELTYEGRSKKDYWICSYEAIADSGDIMNFKPHRHPELAEIEAEAGI